MNRLLTEKQKYQENIYSFPYHYLDLRCEAYKYFWRIEYLSQIEIIKKLLKLYKSQAILDAGCGDGRLCYELKGENIKYVGVDFSKQAISFARAFNPGVDFLVCDLAKLKLSQKFDIVVFMETLEHLLPNKIPAVLENLNKVLKKNGKLIITVPSKNVPTRPKHYQHFDEKSLKKVLQSYFEIEKMAGYSKIGFNRFLFFKLRAFSFMFLPIKGWFGFIEKVLNLPRRYYKKYLEKASLDNCLKLVAVCKKKG